MRSSQSLTTFYNYDKNQITILRSAFIYFLVDRLAVAANIVDSFDKQRYI